MNEATSHVEATCDWLYPAKPNFLSPSEPWHVRRRCNAPAVVLGIIGYRRCRAHASLAPEQHVLSNDDILAIIGDVVNVCEDECRLGHETKRDELSLGLWKQVLKRLAEREAAHA